MKNEIKAEAAPALLAALKRINRTSIKDTFHGDVSQFQKWLDAFTSEVIALAEEGDMLPKLKTCAALRCQDLEGRTA